MSSSDPADPNAHTRSAFWDERFRRDGYYFGTEPAQFLKEHAGPLDPASRVLSICDGQGRNSVFLAGLGHDVVAFDISPVGVANAKRLAESTGVSVEYQVAEIEDWDWSQRIDAVVAIFFQFAPPALRKAIFLGLSKTIKPGGLLLLHGYAPRQIGYGTGGPPFVENLYDLPLLENAFAGWDIIVARDYDAEISEGPGHSGRSALVDFVARKPG